MDKIEKLLRIELKLSEQHLRAWNRLLRRHEAEYTAKGLQKGDDQSLDQKFQEQKSELKSIIDKRSKEFHRYVKEDRVNEFSQRLDKEIDPYGLDSGIDEPELTDDYLKGFNHGYRLQSHDPTLADRLIKAAGPDSDWRKGAEDGQKQQDKEKSMDASKNISPEIWDELNQATKDITQGRGRSPDRSKDKDKDID